MRRIDPEIAKSAQFVLEKAMVFTFDQLLSVLNCSTRTGRARLRQWGTYNSYNQNGRYYCMPSVPRFDEYGLWRYQDIYFSKQRTLKKTVLHLVNQSSSGLTGNQIGDILGLSARSFLHHFRDVPGIRREKKEGHYVYFSADPDKYQEQMHNRFTALRPSGPLLTDAEAIVILTALIKHHNISIEQIAALPEIKAREISPIAIRQFMEHHELILKKTPGIKP